MMLAMIAAEAIVRGLLHSVWQSAILLVVLYLFLAALKDSRKRYAVSLCAFALICAIAVADIAYFHSFKPASDSAAQVVTDYVPAAPLQSSSASASEPQHSASFNLKSINWYEFCAGAWIFGASCLLLRLLIMLLRGATLVGGAMPVADGAILARFEELREKLKIRGRVVLLASEKVAVPLVAGVVRPVILMPLCMLSEHSLQQVSAALAHELIHIRRFDPFVNLLQIMAESILFFNPAVWIVSRQIRIEREAACDSIAISHTGNAEGYVELLLDFVSRVCPQKKGLAVAFADGEKPSVDRVRRILQPGYKPAMRFGVLPFLAAALICAVFACLTWSGSEKAFSYMGEKLSSEEKIQKIAELDKELGSEANIEFSGFVVNENDEPVTGFNLNVRTANSSIGLGGGGCGGEPVNTFKTNLSQKGLCEVTVSADGYAYYYDKFAVREDSPIMGYRVVLSPGFKAGIALTDSDGNAIEGAEIELRVMGEEYALGHGITCLTDAGGTAEVERACGYPLQAVVTADGFEQLETQLQFTGEGDSKSITLTRSEPCTVYVVNSAGEPVEGAKLWMTFINKAGHQYHKGMYGEPVVSSDAAGAAPLTTLVNGWSYTIVATADGLGYGSCSAKAGDEQTLVLPPATVIEGVIKGKDLENRLMKSYWKDGQRYENPAIYVNSRFDYALTESGPFKGISNQYKSVEVEIVDGAGFFTIENAFGNQIEFRVGSDTVGEVDFDYLKGGSVEYFIDLDEQDNIKKQKVLIHFRQPEGMPAPNGEVMLAEDVTQEYRAVKVVEGLVETEVKVPANLRVYMNNQSRLTGYTFTADYNEKYPVDKLTDEPFEFSYEVTPAGCIVGRVIDAEGKMVGARVQVASYEKRYKSFNQVGNATSWNAGESGEYIASPLETGREYVVTAMLGNYLTVSEPILITDKKLIANCDLTIGRTTSISGRILNQDGSPASGVEVGGNLQGYGRYDSLGKVLTDADGHFVIAGVNPDRGIKCHISVNSLSSRFTIDDVRGELGTLKIPAVRQKTITVVNKYTKEPIAGINVRASSRIKQSGCFTNQSMEGLTGSDGKCSVDILADADEANDYSIYIDASRNELYGQSTTSNKEVFELQPMFGLKGRFVDADTGEPAANLKFKFHGRYETGTTYNSYRFDSLSGSDGSFNLGHFHPENIILDETNGYTTDPAVIEFHFDKDNITRDAAIKVRRITD